VLTVRVVAVTQLMVVEVRIEPTAVYSCTAAGPVIECLANGLG